MKKVEYHFWTLEQFREEEEWLNQKAMEGWALTDAIAIRYVFVPCCPGEYTYKIMFTDEMPNIPARKDFEAFMAESGIEVVGKFHRWGYYRKKNDGTPFQLFNSKSEELAHVNKIKNFAALIMTIMVLCLFSELIAVIHNPYMLPLLMIVALMASFVFKVYKGLIKMSKSLEKEISLFE